MTEQIGEPSPGLAKRFVMIDITTFTEIAVAERELSDAWLDLVTSIVDDDGGTRVPLLCEKVTVGLTKLSELIKASYYASVAEAPSKPGSLQ